MIIKNPILVSLAIKRISQLLGKGVSLNNPRIIRLRNYVSRNTPDFYKQSTSLEFKMKRKAGD